MKSVEASGSSSSTNPTGIKQPEFNMPDMDSQRWEYVQDLFLTLVDLESEARLAQLDTLCEGDAQLRSEVLSLLGAHERAGAFLEDDPLLPPGAFGDDLLGRQIGSYRTVEQIGRGGMGAVFLAERADGQFDQEVALKLIQFGIVSEPALERFFAERQILASLQHPNIAYLLDGGVTEDGLPYFAMEYVAGLPVTRFCDEKKLTLEQRLALFLDICDAVHYAHRRLVVHQDLKPSNILVTENKSVKLLDFGVASMLEEKIVRERSAGTAFRALTPEYASPEQIESEVITTSSDVYGLGVLLYELLTGSRPYRISKNTREHIRNVVCSVLPRPPSSLFSEAGREALPDALVPTFVSADDAAEKRSTTPRKLRRHLKGDLDHIALKALQKEPEDRYVSVDQLAEDIRRALSHRPVVAQVQTPFYRARKFIRRNQIAVVAAALVSLALVGGILATANQARVAERERVRAEQRFNDVRALANAVLFDLHDAIADLPGSTSARELLVEHGLTYLDGLAQEPGTDPDLLRELALAYQRVGDVQGNPTNANLGITEEARESYLRGIAIAEKLAQTFPNDPEARRVHAITLEKMADLEMWTGRPDQAYDRARQALAIFRTIAERHPNDTRHVRSYAISLIKMGDTAGNPTYPNYGDEETAFTSFQESLEILSRLHAADPEDAASLRYLGLANERLGTLEEHRENLTDARRYYEESIRIQELFAQAYPGHTDGLRDVAVGHERMGNLHLRNGEVAEALANYDASHRIFRFLADADETNYQARFSLAISHLKLVDAFARAGQDGAEQGAQHLDAARRILVELYEQDPDNTRVAELYDRVQSPR